MSARSRARKRQRRPKDNLRDARRALLAGVIGAYGRALDQLAPDEVAIVTTPASDQIQIDRATLTPERIAHLRAVATGPRTDEILESRDRGWIRIAIIDKAGALLALVSRDAESLITAPGGCA